MPEVKQWAEQGGGTAAAAGCSAAGAPALAPLCRELGSKLAGFVYDGIASLAASVPAGDYDPTAQSAAQAALFDGYASLAVTFAAAVKQLAIQVGTTEQRVVDVLGALGVPSHLASRPRGPSFAPWEWHGEPYPPPVRPDDYWRDDDPRLSPSIMPFRPSPSPQPPLWYINRTGDDNDGLYGLSISAVNNALSAMQAYAQHMLEVLPLAASELVLHKGTMMRGTQFSSQFNRTTFSEASPVRRDPAAGKVRSWWRVAGTLAAPLTVGALAFVGRKRRMRRWETPVALGVAATISIVSGVRMP